MLLTWLIVAMISGVSSNPPKQVYHRESFDDAFDEDVRAHLQKRAEAEAAVKEKLEKTKAMEKRAASVGKTLPPVAVLEVPTKMNLTAVARPTVSAPTNTFVVSSSTSATFATGKKYSFGSTSTGRIYKSTGSRLSGTDIHYNPESIPEIEGMSNGGTVFSFSPIFVQSTYQDNDLFHCLSVTFNLPSGVVNDVAELKKKLHVSVSDDGFFLVIKCVWPEKISDDKKLESALRKSNVHESTITQITTGYCLEIKEIKKLSGNDYVGSIAKIQLRTTCDRKIINRVFVKDQVTVLLRQYGQEAEKEEEDFIDADSDSD
jgi:hypothetical protein